MRKQAARLMLDIASILVGSVLTALGLAVFTVPNQIAPGGVSGVATAIAHITPLRVGTLSLLLNIPIMLLAWRKLGLKPLAKTIAATVMLSVAIDACSVLIPAYTNNTLLAAVVGGGLMGAGLGLMLIRGISTGGTDLIGLMLLKYGHGFSLGQLLMIIDTAVVLFAVAVFRNIEVALYSVVTLFVASKTIDAIQQGVDYAKVIYIVTDQEGPILQWLAQDMGRGVTVLPARGGFTGKDKVMLMTIARRSEVSLTLRMVRDLDPRAFIILSEATEVHGEGFKEMQD